MDNNKKKHKKIRLVVDIVSYTIIAVCFIFTLIGVILKFNRDSLYIFGKTFDVVLTDSMSSKNPEWEDFLKGHDNQIQAFDIAISEQVVSEKQIDIYDIVIFNNPHVGKDMHRIVGKTQIGQDEITISDSNLKTLNQYQGIGLDQITSSITSNTLFIRDIWFTIYSIDSYSGSRFNFNVSGTDYTPDINQYAVENGFMTQYHVSLDGNKPGLLTIAHKYDYNYSKEVLVECKIYTSRDEIVVTKDSVQQDGNNLKGAYNPHYKYEIRGDKAKTSDGEFTIDKIYGKVTGTIPKLGYLIKFLTSIWGTVMFISLGVILLTFEIVSGVIDKKEKAKAAANAVIENQEEVHQEDEQKGNNDS